MQIVVYQLTWILCQAGVQIPFLGKYLAVCPLADYGTLWALVLPQRKVSLAIQSALQLTFPLYSYWPSNRGRPWKQEVSECCSPVPRSGGTARECWKQLVQWGISQCRGLRPAASSPVHLSGWGKGQAHTRGAATHRITFYTLGVFHYAFLLHDLAFSR